MDLGGTKPRIRIRNIRSFFHPRSASKNLNILTQKIVSKLSEIWSGLFIPDPDPDFFYPSRIPGSKRHRIPDPDPRKKGGPRRDLLMLDPSRKRAPLLPVTQPFSEPARSIMESFATFTSADRPESLSFCCTNTCTTKTFCQHIYV